MLTSAIPACKIIERDDFDFLSRPGANLWELGKYFKEIIGKATDREGKKLLARLKRVYGNKLFKDVIALFDWKKELSEQSTYIFKRFLALNPYHAERYLHVLPALGDRFTEFVEILDDARGEDGLVTPKQIRDLVRQFLPARGPRPKFDPGNELTEEHLAYFKKKLLGRSRKAEVIAEKEVLYATYLSAAEAIADGQPVKVEHLATAIARCGGDPAALLPRPSGRFTIWNVRDFRTGDDLGAVLEDPETDGSENGIPEDDTVNSSSPDTPESVETGETLIESGENENEPIASATDTGESPNPDNGGQPAEELPATIPAPASGALPSPPSAVPGTRTGDGDETLSKPRPFLRPGMKVRTTGDREVGRLSKRVATGWLVTFKGDLTRLLPEERLIPLSDGAPTANVASVGESRSKKPKKKGFGRSVA